MVQKPTETKNDSLTGDEQTDLSTSLIISTAPLISTDRTYIRLKLELSLTVLCKDSFILYDVQTKFEKTVIFMFLYDTIFFDMDTVYHRRTKFEF
jgi:hypothetical protein